LPISNIRVSVTQMTSHKFHSIQLTEIILITANDSKVKDALCREELISLS